MSYLLINGDARRIPLGDGTVHCCVTSPPYFGLRDYGCDGQIGLEPTPDAFVAAMVEVFREVRRVLRDDGVIFVNLGDAYASSGGVTSDIRDCLYRLMEGSPLIIGDAVTIRVTAHGRDVPCQDERFPYRVFLPLLGVERVTIKQRNNDFCQVLHTLADPCYCWIGCPVAAVTRDVSDLEIVLDSGYDPGIVITDHQPDREAIFGVSWAGLAGASKGGDGALAVEETGEPVAEAIRDREAIGHPVPLDAPSKRLPDVYLVNESVPLGDRLDPLPGPRADFRVAQASPEQLALQSEDGRFHLRTSLVSHLFIPNEFGSLVRYGELYGRAIRKSNASRPKQELGIPDMVKRALMEDGWICRSTIIWAKPNPMPESVTDRPTKSHEYVFLLAKSERYFFDATAVRENFADERMGNPGKYNSGLAMAASTTLVKHGRGVTGEGWSRGEELGGRNIRTVWTIPTQSYTGAHFATFPRRLVEPCVKAGTSERGCCPRCGAPWERVVERESMASRPGRYSATDATAALFQEKGSGGNVGLRFRPESRSTTLGWRPTCPHDLPPTPCVVLDPFAGSGTTLQVADALGRHGIGLDLSREYLDLARRRLSRPHARVPRPGKAEPMPLFDGAV